MGSIRAPTIIVLTKEGHYERDLFIDPRADRILIHESCCPIDKEAAVELGEFDQVRTSRRSRS